MIDIDIYTVDKAWNNSYEKSADFPTLEEYVEYGIRNGLSYAGVTLVTCTGEIAVRLDTDENIRALNKEWRGKDSPTNVLSFQNMEFKEAGKVEDYQAFLALGDIVLALETVKREAEEQGKGFNEHLSHLLVHGTLHLLGFDHMDDSEAEQMEQMETKILSQMNIPNPYA